MTLDEAIAHAEAVAQSCDGECAEDHRQLAEWLKELAGEQRKVLILMTEANSLRSENEKLLSELEAEHALAESLGHCHELSQAENEKLRYLVMLMYKYYVSGTLSECELCDWMLDCENHPALSCKHGDYYSRSEFANGVFEDRIREFGIETD